MTLYIDQAAKVAALRAEGKESFLFTSESVGEGHPGMDFVYLACE